MKKVLHSLARHKMLSAAIGISIVLYFLTLFIEHKDVKFIYRWIAFCAFVLPIILTLACWLIQHKQALKSYSSSVFKTKEIELLLILCILGVTVNFLLIAQYPFVSIADEMRDSGLWAKKIISDSGINIFSYGSYDGYGLVSSLFTIPFYFLFGDSVLTYRFLAAILATLDIPLLYILARYNFMNKQSAFWASFVLALLPLHMFYARTESIVAFDSFWAIVLFIIFSVWLRRRMLIDYVFLGTMIGFIFNFHTSVRILAFLIGGLALLITAKTFFKKETKTTRGSIVGKVVLLVVFCFVGFGPTILFSNTGNYFQSNRYVYSNNAEIINYTPSSDKFDTLHANYIKSLMVWFYEPTTSHYPSHNPIFPPFIAIFFLLGIGYAFFVLKNSFLYAAIFFILALTFTNSAMTDWVNADHRLVPLFALGALFAGIGITYCMQGIKYKIGKVIFAIIVVSYLLSQAAVFFINRPADQGHDLKEYLAMHIYYFLQEHEQDFVSSRLVDSIHASPVRFCILVSPESSKLLDDNNDATREQSDYFLQKELTVHFSQNASVRDNEAYVKTGDCQESKIGEEKHMKLIDCSLEGNLKCPLNYTDQIRIYY